MKLKVILICYYTYYIVITTYIFLSIKYMLKLVYKAFFDNILSNLPSYWALKAGGYVYLHKVKNFWPCNVPQMSEVHYLKTQVTHGTRWAAAAAGGSSNMSPSLSHLLCKWAIISCCTQLLSGTVACQTTSYPLFVIGGEELDSEEFFAKCLRANMEFL